MDIELGTKAGLAKDQMNPTGFRKRSEYYFDKKLPESETDPGTQPGPLGEQEFKQPYPVIQEGSQETEEYPASEVSYTAMKLS